MPTVVGKKDVYPVADAPGEERADHAAGTHLLRVGWGNEQSREGRLDHDRRIVEGAHAFEFTNEARPPLADRPVCVRLGFPLNGDAVLKFAERVVARAKRSHLARDFELIGSLLPRVDQDCGRVGQATTSAFASTKLRSNPSSRVMR